MNRRLGPLFYVCAVAVVASSSHTWGAIALPNLPAGSQYQLIFVTAGMRDATSSSITDYNAFVTAEAALNPALPQGVGWHAVATTSAVDAKDNAPSDGLPVYNTAGIRVAALTLYTQVLSSPIKYNQYGDLALPLGNENDYAGGPPVWTGSSRTGTASTGGVLGNAGAEHGYAFSSFLWTDGSNTSSSLSFPFYALSDPITVPLVSVTVPEPSARTVWGLLLLGAFAASQFHRTRGIRTA